MTRLMTVPEVAEALALKPATIRKLIAQRRIPVVRPAGVRAVRVRAEDVESMARVDPGSYGRVGNTQVDRGDRRRSTRR